MRAPNKKYRKGEIHEWGRGVRVRQKGLAVGFIILVLGVILVAMSHTVRKMEYYDLINVKSFSLGQPLEFYWTFEANKSYRFEVKAINWTVPSPAIHWFCARNGTLLSSSGLISPPYVWDHNTGDETETLRVAWWRYDEGGKIVETANAGAYVEISELQETTSRPTYLVYAGVSLIMTGATLLLIIGWNYPRARVSRDG